MLLNANFDFDVSVANKVAIDVAQCARPGKVIQCSPCPEVRTLTNETKEKYQGMFKIQKSGDKTSSGEIGLDIRTHASAKVGQDQVSGGVSVLCWHAAPVAYVLWKPCTIR